MPPEWYEHECCWMQWPHEDPNRNSYLEVESWSHFDFEKGRHKWAEVAKAISNFEKVKMIVHPIDLILQKRYSIIQLRSVRLKMMIVGHETPVLHSY